MEFKDYYTIMGVSEDAAQDEIRRAYRKLARKYHPDVSKEADAETRFKELGEAYEALKDPEKRATYDQLRKGGWQAGQEFHPPPGWDTGFEFSGSGRRNSGPGAASFSDFFESLFGAGSPFGSTGPAVHRPGHRQGNNFAQRGEDHHAKLPIRLEEAYRGSERTVTLQVPVVDARGHVTTQPHSLKVKIPAGVSEGQQIRLTRQGAPGRGRGEPGDLYLTLVFEPHPLFHADDRDIYLTLPITPWEAALGAKVAVPTLGGAVDMKVSAGAQSGQKLRLKGRGLPARSGGQATVGDQYVVLQIRTPRADTDAQKKLYEDMAHAMSFNPRASLGV